MYSKYIFLNKFVPVVVFKAVQQRRVKRSLTLAILHREHARAHWQARARAAAIRAANLAPLNKSISSPFFSVYNKLACFMCVCVYAHVLTLTQCHFLIHKVSVFLSTLAVIRVARGAGSCGSCTAVVIR